METDKIFPYAIVDLSASTPNKPSERVVAYCIRVPGAERPKHQWSGENSILALQSMGIQAGLYSRKGTGVYLDYTPNLYLSIIKGLRGILPECTFAKRTLNEKELNRFKKAMEETIDRQESTLS